MVYYSAYNSERYRPAVGFSKHENERIEASGGFLNMLTTNMDQ